MTTTSILPDPFACPIKLGRYPRRRYGWRCTWADWPNGQEPITYKGTPAVDRPIRHAAALSRVLYMTRSEAMAMVAKHHAELAGSAADLKRNGETDRFIADWWERAEAAATIQVPSWLARELDRVHGEAFIRDRVAAAAVFRFAGLRDKEIVRWCEYAQQREAEARAIDDEAHAALRSIMS